MSAGERIHKSEKKVCVFMKYKYNEDLREVFKSKRKKCSLAIECPERQ